MSNTTSGITKKGDAWLGRMGIGVHRLRAKPAMSPLPATPAPPPRAPTPIIGTQRMPSPPVPPPPAPARPAFPPTPQGFYEAARAKAQPLLDEMDAATAAARPTAEVFKFVPEYSAATTAIDTAVSSANYEQALADLQAKIAVAEKAKLALAYDTYWVGKLQDPRVEKAKLLLVHSGILPGMEAAAARFTAAKKQLDAALAKRDYAAAETLRNEADQAAVELAPPYDALLLAERNRPLFQRAEKLFAQSKLAPELKEWRDNYAGQTKMFEKLRKGKDLSGLKDCIEAKVFCATHALMVSQKASVDEWFTGSLAAPAASAGPRKVLFATVAEAATTMPAFSKMDGAMKFREIAAQVGIEPPRVSRRLFGLSHAAMSGCSSIA